MSEAQRGVGRFKIGAHGYAATLVNGAVVTEQGANTAERPGRAIRKSRDGAGDASSRHNRESLR